MVDRERVDQLLALLARYLHILRDLADEPIEEIRNDPRVRGSAERYLQLAIETALNIGHHVIAARSMRQADDYADVFRVLGEEGVLDTDFARSLEPMAGMRNRLVHVYWEVDADQLHDLLQTRLDDFDRFAAEVIACLDSDENNDDR